MSVDEWCVEWSEAGWTKRALIADALTIGRSDDASIRVNDPYVSRRHCTIRLVDGTPVAEAAESLNRIRVAGEDFASVKLGEGDVFVLGRTAFIVRRVHGDETTQLLRDEGKRFHLRASTRELLDHEGTLIAQFSASEFAALDATVRRYPDAASHSDIARAVWGELGYDPYQIHRLMQRVRQRLGNASHLLENVRGAGYRLSAPIETL